MGGNDEIIIRNGSLKEWTEYALLNYYVTFGGNRVRAVYVVVAAVAAAFIGGRFS